MPAALLAAVTLTLTAVLSRTRGSWTHRHPALAARDTVAVRRPLVADALKVVDGSTPMPFVHGC